MRERGEEEGKNARDETEREREGMIYLTKKTQTGSSNLMLTRS